MSTARFRRLACLSLLALGTATGSIATAQPAAEPPGASPVAEVARAATAIGTDRLDARLAAIEVRLSALALEHHVPGYSVAIVVDGEPVLVEGYGIRDLAEGDAVDAETIFAIGSSTKSMTSVLAAMLDADGTLPLGTKAIEALPGFRFADEDTNAEATLADLMNHRSGVMRSDLLWYGGYATWDEIAAAFAEVEPVDEFGEAFHYQNICFAAAGKATAHAVRLDWSDLLRQRLLTPLGMRRTTPSVDVLWTDAAATGYDPGEVGENHPRDDSGTPILRWAIDGEVVFDASDEDGRRYWRRRDPRDLSMIAPAGAVNSNATEMARWLQWVATQGAKPEGGPSLSAESFERLWTPANDLAPGIQYGLGFMIRDVGGRRMVDHGGNIDGFSSQVAWLPDDRIGVSVLANLSRTPMVALAAQAVIDELLADDPTPIAEAGGASGAADASLARYAGEYDASLLFGRPVTVAVDGDGLTMDVPGQIVYRLTEEDENGMRAFDGFPQIQIRFVEDEAEGAEGTIRSVELHQGGVIFEWLRDGARYPIEEPLDGFTPLVGRYELVPGAPPARVTVIHDRLSIEVPGETTYALHPADEDGWRRFREVGLIAVKFQTDEGGGPATALVLRAPNGAETTAKRVDDGDRPLPSIDELMLQVQIAGGRDEWESKLGLRLAGTVVAPNQGLSGTCVIDLSGYTRLRERMDFGQYGWVETGMFMSRTWYDASFQPFQPGEPGMAPTVQHLHPFLHLAEWSLVHESTAVIGRRQEGDRTFVQVRAEVEGNRPATIEIDEATWLVHRIESSVLVPGMGAIPREIRFEDWRFVDGGLRVPFRIVTDDPGFGRVERTFETTEFDIDYGEEIFRKHHPGD